MPPIVSNTVHVFGTIRVRRAVPPPVLHSLLAGGWPTHMASMANPDLPKKRAALPQFFRRTMRRLVSRSFAGFSGKGQSSQLFGAVSGPVPREPGDGAPNISCKVL